MLIYTLIPMAMAEVAAIPKLRNHAQQNWAYRGYEDYLTAFRPALLKHGLFLVPEVLGTETGETASKDKGTPQRHILVTVAYSIFAPDGSMVRAVVVGEAVNTGDNAATIAMADAFTTFLTQTFCIPTGEPIGGARTGQPERPAPAPRQPQRSADAPIATPTENTLPEIVAALKSSHKPDAVDAQLKKWAKGRDLADLGEGELNTVFTQARNWLASTRQRQLRAA